MSTETLNKSIKQNFDYEFEVSEDGLYAIEIIANCRSWWQNLIKLESFFKDDDLALKIDDIEFPKLNSKKGLFDGEVAWNGNNLKGLQKINLFVIFLKKGKHTIHFLNDQQPFLKSVNISHLKDPKEFNYVPSEENTLIEDGNRRQWLTFILVNLALKHLFVKASAEKRKGDDDDLKLIIDSQIQKNTELKSHKHWYWCGRTLRGKSKEFDKEVNLEQGMHYIELWADRRPILHRVGFGIGDMDLGIEAKVVWQETILREEPNQQSSILIEKVKKDEKVILLEKAIQGERVKNEQGVLLSTNRWHRVKYQNQEGYIYSLALEIGGEDKETIKKLIIQKSQKIKEDYCLMLAIAQRESDFFPYAVSDMGAEGIFQLKKDAAADVNEKFHKKFLDRFDIYQNIESGILYFQLIKEKYKNKDHFWERCLAAWNRGWGKIKTDEPFIINNQPVATQQFIRDVFKFWEDCKESLKRGGRLLIFSLLIVAVLTFIISARVFFKEQFPLPTNYTKFYILDNKRADIDNDGQEERVVVLTDKLHSTFCTTKVFLIEKDGTFVAFPDDDCEFQWLKVDDFNQNKKMDIALLFGYSGSAGFGHFYLYEWNKSGFKTLFAREDIGSEVDFQDMNSDGIKEILYTFYPSKWEAKRTEVYQWDKEKAVFSPQTDLVNPRSRGMVDILH